MKNKISKITLLGLLISVLLNFYYVGQFDKHDQSVKNLKNHNQDQHMMIKSDTEKFWFRAHNLNIQLNSGLDYFETGQEYRVPYLPSKILYLFSKVSNLQFYDQEKDEIILESFDGNLSKRKITLGYKKVFFLILQSLLYYLSIFFLYSKIKDKLDNRNTIFLITFLSFEPTILLFHSSFWSESIFFTLLIFSISLIIEQKISLSKNLLIGLLLGLLFLQRSVAIYYVLIVIIYYFFIFKRKSIKPVISLLTGYFLIILFLGYHNFKRSDNFYIQPTQAKDGFYVYLAPNIYSLNEKISIKKANLILDKKLNQWIKEKNLDLENETDRLIYYEYLQNKSFEIILDKPLNSLVIILKRTMHYLVLDPLRHVHYFYKFNLREQNSFYKTEIADKWILPRLIYSFLIYSTVLISLIYMFKNRDYDKFKLFLIFSLIYFIAVSSWTGNNRYNVPNLVFLAFFASNGMAILSNYLKRLQKF